jgi:hypothetical protein
MYRGTQKNTCTVGPKRQCLSLSPQKRSYKYVALSRWCTRTWSGSSSGPQSWYMRCSDGGQEEGEAEASGCKEEGQKSTQMSAESREMRNACIWPCTHTVSMGRGCHPWCPLGCHVYAQDSTWGRLYADIQRPARHEAKWNHFDILPIPPNPLNYRYNPKLDKKSIDDAHRRHGPLCSGP